MLTQQAENYDAAVLMTDPGLIQLRCFATPEFVMSSCWELGGSQTNPWKGRSDDVIKRYWRRWTQSSHLEVYGGESLVVSCNLVRLSATNKQVVNMLHAKQRRDELDPK